MLALIGAANLFLLWLRGRKRPEPVRFCAKRVDAGAGRYELVIRNLSDTSCLRPAFIVVVGENYISGSVRDGLHSGNHLRITAALPSSPNTAEVFGAWTGPGSGHWFSGASRDGHFDLRKRRRVRWPGSHEHWRLLERWLKEWHQRRLKDRFKLAAEASIAQDDAA
ncbi:MAG: hypothetical protein LC797_21765 [Chloroflexi bacterium]|nr:hypothetical protein [Chloroflexota bacterium]